MKKKYSVTKEDKKNWFDFLARPGGIYNKDAVNVHAKENVQIGRVKKLDLHGMSLGLANQIVKKFIIKSFNENYKKILIVTGKGLRSKVYNNPYISKSMNVLKYSIPEYVKNDVEIFNKIRKIAKASSKDGGEGAFYIYLKKKNL